MPYARKYDGIISPVFDDCCSKRHMQEGFFFNRIIYENTPNKHGLIKLIPRSFKSKLEILHVN
jgi:hypothetical protein